MHTKIKITASYSESSDNKNAKHIESFRRFEFNHPLNPFRLASDKTRIHINHLNAEDVNEGLISVFEKRLDEIQLLLVSEEKSINQMSKLTNKLYHEITTFSTIPCSANIDPSIFEHLNYILQLLYDWQDYAAILKEIEKDTPNYIKKVSEKFKISTQEVTIKVNHFNRKFLALSKEILSEITIIKKAIQKTHIKHGQFIHNPVKKTKP